MTFREVNATVFCIAVIGAFFVYHIPESSKLIGTAAGVFILISLTAYWLSLGEDDNKLGEDDDKSSNPKIGDINEQVE